LSETWNTAGATVGYQCFTEEAKGPSVWYRFVGTGEVLTLSGCDFSRNLDSGFNIFATDRTGSCDAMACLGGTPSASSSSCAFDQASAVVSWRSVLNGVYYIEVYSFADVSGFDQNEAGTRGFVRIRTNGA